MLPGVAEQRVVVEEPHHRLRRKVEHAGGWRRPDRAAEWQQVAVAEPRPGSEPGQEVAHRHAGVGGGAQRLRVEPHYVADHPQESGAREVRWLRRHRRQVAQAVFDAPPAEGGAEAHVARRDRHVEFLEELDEPRIGAPVEDDETGIDRLVAPPARHDRAGMATEARRRLDQRDPVVSRQQVRGTKPRDPAADHGDPAGGCGHRLERHRHPSC